MKPERENSANRFSRYALPLLLLATVLAYGNSFAGVWQFDDYAVLLADARVQSWSAWWQSLPHIRPLFKLSVTLNHESGLGLFGFHLFNLLLHLANTVLVHRIVAQLLLRVGMVTSAGWLVTIVFALHPAQTEAVTYLSGRSVALEAFGLLLACFAMLRYQPQASRQNVQHALHQASPPQWRQPMLIAVGVLVALASRESAVIAPLLLAWLAWFDGMRPAAEEASKRARRRLFWGSLLAALFLLIAVLLLPRYRELLWLALQWPDFATLLAIQSQALLHLIVVAFGLQALNADPALVIAPLASVRPVVTLLLLLAMAGMIWRLHRRQPLFGFALGWLLIIWLPTHSLFVRLDPVNDRQLYLALPALAGLLALLSREALTLLSARLPLPVGKWRGLDIHLLIMLALLLAVGTGVRNTVYVSEQAFWQDVVSKAPHNARGWNNLAIAYANAGEQAAAEAALRQALQQRPDYLRAAVNLKLLRAGRPLQ